MVLNFNYMFLRFWIAVKRFGGSLGIGRRNIPYISELYVIIQVGFSQLKILDYLMIKNRNTKDNHFYASSL